MWIFRFRLTLFSAKSMLQLLDRGIFSLRLENTTEELQCLPLPRLEGTAYVIGPSDQVVFVWDLTGPQNAVRKLGAFI